MMKKLLFALIAALAVCHASAATDTWRIDAQRVDTMKRYVGATASNGEIGITLGQEPMAIERIFCATAVADGSAENISKLLPALNPFALKLVDAAGHEIAAGRTDQAIDMRRAVHTSSIAYPDFELTYQLRALRSLPHAGMIRLSIKADRPVNFYIVNTHSVPKALADGAIVDSRIVKNRVDTMKMSRSAAPYNRGRDHIVAMSAFGAAKGPSLISPDTLHVVLPKGATVQVDLFGVICTSAEYADPWNEAERQLIYAVREGGDRLIAKHERLWNELWANEITVPGNVELTRQAHFALYNIYSALSPGSRRSIAPLGLTGPGYYGHIFWDAETWIFPVVLRLNPTLAKDMISYRIDALDAARVRARAHGYRGAMFPWESDANGEESTPTFALTGPLEHHITADVANAAWDYFEATADTTWLSDQAYPLIRDCADFWVSRVAERPDGSYSICNVVGADEYAISVDDNAFTNGAAQRNLRVADRAARICGHTPDPVWLKVADGLRILRMDNGVTAEYDGYDGQMIKQADVNLLAYPLDVITDPAQIKRDLDYYSPRLDRKHGPAMARSVLAVLYDRIGQRDEALRQLESSYRPHLRPPFGVFAETPSNNKCYFLTGAGAFLQALLELFPQN